MNVTGPNGAEPKGQPRAEGKGKGMGMGKGMGKGAPGGLYRAELEWI